jgi:hypothetical protein
MLGLVWYFSHVLDDEFLSFVDFYDLILRSQLKVESDAYIQVVPGMYGVHFSPPPVELARA